MRPNLRRMGLVENRHLKKETCSNPAQWNNNYIINSINSDHFPISTSLVSGNHFEGGAFSALPLRGVKSKAPSPIFRSSVAWAGDNVNPRFIDHGNHGLFHCLGSFFPIRNGHLFCGVTLAPAEFRNPVASHPTFHIISSPGLRCALLEPNHGSFILSHLWQ